MMDMIIRGAVNIGYAGLMLVVGYFAIKYGSMLLHRALAKAESGKYALVVRFITSVAEKVAWAFVVVMALESWAWISGLSLPVSESPVSFSASPFRSRSAVWLAE